MTRLQSACGLLAAMLAALILIACTDELDTAPQELVAATEQELVAATEEEEGSLVERLAANADAFEYEIGDFGGSITSATIAEPLTFNLALANDAGSSSVLSYLFEGLTETSWLTDEIEPALAESWDVSDDGLTWTFYLRRDARWHDGEPFTAADVEFTFNQIIYNEEIPTPSRATFTFRFLNDAGEWEEAPMTVTAIDEYTIQCVLPVSFAPFLRSMGQSIFPEHILGPRVADGTFVETWDINTDPSEIIGTGPFLIDSYEPGERVLFQRNQDYWLTDDAGNRLPYLEQVVLLIVPDLEAELAAFRSGEADVHGVLGEEFADLEPLQEAENFTIYRRGPNFGSNFLSFNMNPGAHPETGEPFVSAEKHRWFTDTQFRRAVSTRTGSSTRFSTDSVTRSGRRSVRPQATSTIPTCAPTSTTSSAATSCSTNSAGPIAMATASARTTKATRSRSHW